MGITHNLVTGVWVGGDERSIHFPSWPLGQGSKSARPIWDKYMVKTYKDPSTGIKKGKFNIPDNAEIFNCAVVDDSTTVIKKPDLNPFN